MRARRRQLRPAGGGARPLVDLVGELGVGDGDLPDQGLAAGRFRRRALGGLLAQQLVAGAVDPGDEEARHRGQPSQRSPGRHAILEPGEIRLQHLFVLQQRENQGDVDAHASGGEGADGRDPFRRGRHLDHDVRASNELGEAKTFRQRLFGGGGELGQHLQGNASVHPAALFIDAGEEVTGAANVVEGEGFIDVRGRTPLADQAAEILFVVTGGNDCLLEMVGSDVRPRTPLATRAASPPLRSRPRRMLSYQILWPSSWAWWRTVFEDAISSHFILQTAG